MVAAPDASLTDALGQLISARGEAIVAGDPRLLPEMSEDFVGTGFTGAVVDLRTWVEIHFAPEPGFERFEPSTMTVWRIGPYAAVLIGQLDVRTGRSAAENTRNCFTSGFRQVDGQWREAVYHETGIPVRN